MKQFYTKYKMQILIGGAFAVGVLILLTLSFGDTSAIVMN